MCFDNKVNELLYVIRNICRLPEEEEFYFEDGEDERAFFDNLEFINIINSEELEKKPVYKIGYELILEILDEYKIEDNEQLKELVVERFKTKLELDKVIENKQNNKIYRLLRKMNSLDKQIKKSKRSKKIKKLGGK